MEWIEIGGAGFRRELAGSGDGTPVLVHDMGGTLESRDFVLPLPRGRRAVLRFDTRGAGRSTKPQRRPAGADRAWPSRVGRVGAAAEATGRRAPTGDGRPEKRSASFR